MDRSDVVAQIPGGMNMIGSPINTRKKIMKVKDLEKYFGALKESDILDEMRDRIQKMREILD